MLGSDNREEKVEQRKVNGGCWRGTRVAIWQTVAREGLTEKVTLEDLKAVRDMTRPISGERAFQVGEEPVQKLSGERNKASCLCNRVMSSGSLKCKPKRLYFSKQFLFLKIMILRASYNVLSLRREQGLRIESITNNQWLSQSCLHIWNLHKNHKWESLDSFCVGEHVMCQKGSATQTPERQKLLCSESFWTLPYVPLYLAVQVYSLWESSK